MNKGVIGLIAVVVLVAVAGGAFWAGMKVGENRMLQNPARVFQQMGRGGQGGQFPRPFQTPQAGQEGSLRFGGGTMGTIEAIEGDVLTVTTQDGAVRVQTTDTTLIQKYTTVGVDDLEIGEQVVVSGSRNDDGSITARSIQSMRGFQSPSSDQP